MYCECSDRTCYRLLVCDRIPVLAVATKPSAFSPMSKHACPGSRPHSYSECCQPYLMSAEFYLVVCGESCMVCELMGWCFTISRPLAFLTSKLVTVALSYQCLCDLTKNAFMKTATQSPPLKLSRSNLLRNCGSVFEASTRHLTLTVILLWIHWTLEYII